MENQFKFSGVISWISELKEGVGKNGSWKSIDFEVTEEGKDYPQKGLFSMFKAEAKFEQMNSFLKYNKVGSKVEVSFSLGVNEYTDKTSGELRKMGKISAYSVFGVKNEQGESNSTTTNYQDSNVQAFEAQASKPLQQTDFSSTGGEGDLPF